MKKITLALTLTLATGAAAAQSNDFGLGKLLGGVKNLNVGSILENGTKVFSEPTEQQEIALGQEFASTLLGARPLLNNPGVQRYVNTLGRWLASQTERPDLPWTFGVLNDDGYNAFATPGGYIFVTKGLLDSMRNEAELAGVLAHEIGHVLRKHHLKAVRVSGLAGLIEEGLRTKVGDNPQLTEATKNIIAKGLDKTDEYEADRLGVVIAARAGYDPFGLPAVLQTLQGQSAQDPAFTFMFKTHPSPADRLSELDALMQGRFDNSPANSGKSIKDRLKEFSR
ncbi:M48 family metallopeptidase [Paucimonas lemoignei]|nr:M48 family metallopeptidase [Paucimonas lemoignei]